MRSWVFTLPTGPPGKQGTPSLETPSSLCITTYWIKYWNVISVQGLPVVDTSIQTPTVFIWWRWVTLQRGRVGLTKDINQLEGISRTLPICTLLRNVLNRHDWAPSASTPRAASVLNEIPDMNDAWKLFLLDGLKILSATYRRLWF